MKTDATTTCSKHPATAADEFGNCPACDLEEFDTQEAAELEAGDGPDFDAPAPAAPAHTAKKCEPCGDFATCTGTWPETGMVFYLCDDCGTAEGLPELTDMDECQACIAAGGICEPCCDRAVHSEEMRREAR
jgi:hypothetical protein